MSTQVHVRESIRVVSDHTWLVGNRLLISRSSTKSPDCLWSDDDGLQFYSVTEVTESLPLSHPLNPADSAPFALVYNAGDRHVVWKVGNAFVKVNIIDFPGATREHLTIAAVKAMSPSFPIPDVLYHGQWDGRYYLILSALPGRTLAEAWPDLDESAKCSLVDRVVEICEELAKHQARYIGGVDQGQLCDQRLARKGEKQDFSHQSLLKTCLDLGMDCSTFMFYHCDLGPGNLIVGPDRSLGVIDWETAGYVPKDWIRTKFRISSGLDLDHETIRYEDSGEWRARVQKRLDKEGYPDLAARWTASWGRGLQLVR